MKITPAEGMNDYLPNETELRDHLIDRIVATYKASGFMKITTPMVESIANLDNSDGGDNLKLIFRILKRGKKLEDELHSGNLQNICDLGLRYDLTLPLARYYANNKNALPTPFKCIQIDRVYRAERPQRGRSREFVQCDIDIIGSESTNCEVELISVTAQALLNIGLKDFTIRINDREILKGIIQYAGLGEEDVNSICISIDKADKIGVNGVNAELIDKGYPAENVNKLLNLLFTQELDITQLEQYGLGEPAARLFTILNQSKAIAGEQYHLRFDITLVRGQGYYTGTVFEIDCPAFGGTIAGGGRYDHLIERFTGDCVPAVGFSIGFERIYSILCNDLNLKKAFVPKIALLYDEGEFVDAILYANTLRPKYSVTLVQKKKKVGKHLSQLEQQGFEHAIFMDDTSVWKKLGNANAEKH